MSARNYWRNMKSILQTIDACWVCGTRQNLHTHEVFYGTANRKKSIKYSLQVKLCGRHHNLSSEGVHFNKALDTQLKMFAQKKFEEKYSHEKFMEVFKKNYL